jgi:hypothetical protein
MLSSLAVSHTVRVAGASLVAKGLAARFASTLANATKEKVIILGAAGRDFHDFMTYWSRQPNIEVKCFTETQIPGIDNRHFPAEMCNNHLNDNLYKEGLSIYPEKRLEELIQRFDANTCTLAYSDLPYDTVQSLASRVNAAGCKFVQLPPSMTQVESIKPVVAVVASRTVSAIFCTLPHSIFAILYVIHDRELENLRLLATLPTTTRTRD